MLAEVHVQKDHTGEQSTLCRVAEDCGSVAHKIVFQVASEYMESRIGVQPLQKGSAAKEAKLQLGKDLKESTAELSFAYCLPDVDADCYATKEQKLIGYMLKYSLYNAYVFAAVMEHYNVMALLINSIATVDVCPADTQSGCSAPSEGLHAAASYDFCHIVSIGGGPLTDWLGVVMHSCAHPSERRFECEVYDLPMWAPLWDRAKQHLGLHGVNAQFRAQDVCHVPEARLPLPTTVHPILFVMMYTICEMVPHAPLFSPMFASLVSRAASGSLVLIVERMRRSAHDYVGQLCTENSGHIEVLVDRERLWTELPTKTALEIQRFVRKFGVKPRTNGPACVTLLRRKGAAKPNS